MNQYYQFEIMYKVAGVWLHNSKRFWILHFFFFVVLVLFCFETESYYAVQADLELVL